MFLIDLIIQLCYFLFYLFLFIIIGPFVVEWIKGFISTPEGKYKFIVILSGVLYVLIRICYDRKVKRKREE